MVKVFRCGPLRNVSHPARRRPALENLPRWKPRGLGAVYGESAVGWWWRWYGRIGRTLCTTSPLGQDVVGGIVLAPVRSAFAVVVDQAVMIMGTVLACRSDRLVRLGL